MESHTLVDGKVHVYRRENSSFWQCAVFLGGRNHRQSAFVSCGRSYLVSL